MDTNTKPTEETYEQKNAREQVENKAIATKRKAVLVKVAKALGYTVEKDREERTSYWNAEASVRCHRADGAAFYASCGGYRNRTRYIFSTGYPKPTVGEISTYELPRPEITCAETKTVEQLVADIKRRLLPDFEAGLKIVNDRIAQTLNYHTKRDENLAKVMGRKLNDEERKTGKARLDGAADDRAYGHITASGDDVSLELNNLKPDLAAKVLALIKAQK